MKTIEMVVRDERGTTSIRETFDEDTTWCAIAYTFYKFLSAQGYHLSPEAVGADVDSYITSAEEDQGELW